MLFFPSSLADVFDTIRLRSAAPSVPSSIANQQEDYRRKACVALCMIAMSTMLSEREIAGAESTNN